MLTYQDILAVGQDEKKRMDFILAAINEHKSSDLYKTAVNAKLYYRGENPTINRYEKIIYDLQGRAHRDMYTANHKIASRFFGMVVDQANSYLLGNGVTFSKSSSKKKLGRNFDREMSKAAESAMIGGVSFGFWNFDRVEVFSVTEFVPLYDEENGALMAGIRWWKNASNKPLRCTLYDPDGLTEYAENDSGDLVIISEKRRYIIRTTAAEMDNTVIYGGENYPTFPIVPLKNNDECKSELCGRRNTIDALDLSCSNMVNNVDEGNLIYWVLSNCGGMDDIDDAEFIDRIKTLHVVHADSDAAQIEPHTIEAPFNGTQATIDMLEKKLYQDFQAFDASAVMAGDVAATAIKARYVPLDLKMDKFERQMTEFINGILALAGIDDEPSYTRNKLINTQEEMQTLMTAAPYLDAEYITTKALTIMGDPDMADEVLKRQAAENLDRFAGVETEVEENG